jgi:cell division protease FtsH
MIKVIVGPHKKSKVISEKSKKLTAYHEAGHAVSSYFVKGHDEVHHISIIPAGRAGGYTLYLPKEDRDYMSKGEMEGSLVSLLGGRVAESLTLDDISTGASNDLERVTSIAKAMVTRYGFSEKLGNVVYGGAPEQTFLGRDYTQGRGHSEAVANDIDVEIRRFVDEGYQKCMDILRTHEDKLHIVAKELMEKEKINGERFKYLMSDDYKPEEDVEETAETVEPVETAETEPTAETTEAVETVETQAETVETAEEKTEE